MSIVHKVTGYDRRTDRLEIEFDLPPDRLGEIQELVHLPPSYENSYGSFPLDPNMAWQISWLLHLPMNVDFYNWYIEPFAQKTELAG